MHIDRFISRGRRNAARKTSPAVEAMEDRKLLTGLGLVVGSGSLVVEGTGANTTMNFVVKLAVPATTTVKVNYATADGTAKAGEDFVATSGVVTFAPGQTVQNVPVTIIGDSAAELSQTFQLRLSDGGNARILTPGVGGTILDDDVVAPAGLSITDVMTTRGLTGSRPLDFTVKLNSPQSTAVTVRVATIDGSATAGVHYQAKSELITFAPGETSKTFRVNVLGGAGSGEKIFFVTLNDSTVSFARRTAAGILKSGA